MPPVLVIPKSPEPALLVDHIGDPRDDLKVLLVAGIDFPTGQPAHQSGAAQNITENQKMPPGHLPGSEFGAVPESDTLAAHGADACIAVVDPADKIRPIFGGIRGDGVDHAVIAVSDDQALVTAPGGVPGFAALAAPALGKVPRLRFPVQTRHIPPGNPFEDGNKAAQLVPVLADEGPYSLIRLGWQALCDDFHIHRHHPRKSSRLRLNGPSSTGAAFTAGIAAASPAAGSP